MGWTGTRVAVHIHCLVCLVLLGDPWGLGFPNVGRHHCVPSLAGLPLVELGDLATVARLSPAAGQYVAQH